MKTTKAIYLTFENFSSTATANIFIPFMVKHIHTRAISYQRAGIAVSTPEYGVLFSDLTINEPLGIYYNDSAYSTTTGSLSMFEFRAPTSINGTYTFSITDASGLPQLPINNPDYIVILLEFQSEYVSDM